MSGPMAKQRERVTREIIGVLNRILKTDEDYAPSVRLAGEDALLDSFSVALFASELEELYGVDIIEGDIDLDCLDSLEACAERVLALL